MQRGDQNVSQSSRNRQTIHSPHPRGTANITLRHLLQHCRSSIQQRILSTIYAHCGWSGVIVIAALATELGISERRLYKHLRYLEDHRLLTRIRGRYCTTFVLSRTDPVAGKYDYVNTISDIQDTTSHTTTAPSSHITAPKGDIPTCKLVGPVMCSENVRHRHKTSVSLDIGTVAMVAGAPLRTSNVKALRRKMPKWKFEKAYEMRRNPTRCEAILWRELRAKQLGCVFRRQHPVYGYIADFYAPRYKLIVEVDGAIHETLFEYDRKRDVDLIRCGFRIVHFTNAEVESALGAVLQKIRRLLV